MSFWGIFPADPGEAAVLARSGPEGGPRFGGSRIGPALSGSSPFCPPVRPSATGPAWIQSLAHGITARRRTPLAIMAAGACLAKRTGARRSERAWCGARLAFEKAAMPDCSGICLPVGLAPAAALSASRVRQLGLGQILKA